MELLDDTKYPYDCCGMRVYKDRNECLTCGAEVGQGIIAISQHWCSCAGKQQFENIMKIKDMPLGIDDKMDLVKKEMNIDQ